MRWLENKVAVATITTKAVMSTTNVSLKKLVREYSDAHQQSFEKTVGSDSFCTFHVPCH